MTGHNTAMIAIEQQDDFTAAPLKHLATLYRGRSDNNFSLYNVTTIVGTTLAGRSHLGMVMTSNLYYLLLIFSVFGIVARLGNRFGAGVAALTAMLMPAAMAWSRVVSPHIALMAVSAFGVYLIVVSDYFSRWLPTLLFGALAALSLHLGETVSDSFQVLLVLAVVAGYSLIVRFAVLREQQKRALVSLVLAALAFFLLLDYHFLKLLALPYLLNEAIARANDKYAAGNIFRHAYSAAAYPFLLWNYHLFPLHCLAGLAAMVAVLRKPRTEGGLALVFLLIPLTVATLISKKNYNYIFAFLPALPVIVGLAATRLARNRLALVVVALFITTGIVQFYSLSYTNNRNIPFMSHAIGKSIIASVFQTSYFPVLPKVDKRNLLIDIAPALNDLSKQQKGTTFLLLATGKESRPMMIFRYLLRLQNSDGQLRVVDPIYQVQSRYGEYFLSNDILHPFRPDVVLLHRMGNPVFRDRGFLDPEQLYAYFYSNDLVRYRVASVERLHKISEYWAEMLAEIPLDEYESTNYPLYYPSHSPGKPITLYRDPQLPPLISLPVNGD